LLHAELLVAGQPCRLQEIEFYWFSPEHPDPFCHRHPLQRHHGCWYFHRVGSAYRGGSFKGLDITFSDGQGFGGILLRGLLRPDGSVISGPSRLVDFLLQATGFPRIVDLDTCLQHHPVVLLEASWPNRSEPPAAPLILRSTATPLAWPIYATARVGLTLPPHHLDPATLDFFGRPYRFLTLPHTLAAGRPQLIVALHQSGLSPQAIRSLTHSPLPTIHRYLHAYHTGYYTSDSAALATLLHRRPRSATHLCQLYGFLARLLTTQPPLSHH
jgi:hypothetical protein